MPNTEDFPRYSGPLPWLTTEQMRAVDRIAVDGVHLQLVQMMENAGRALAHVARVRFLRGSPANREVVVMAGKGGNGGGALVGARRLSAWGANVRILLAHDPDDFRDVPRLQLDVARRSGLDVKSAGEPLPLPPDLILDGIIGYGIRSGLAGEAARLIRWANGSGCPVLALDVPSGLDATTGEPHDPAVRAAATLTLALPKVGLRAASSASHVGELYLADIGIPQAVYDSLALDEPVPALFSGSDIPRLDLPAASQHGAPPHLPSAPYVATRNGTT